MPHWEIFSGVRVEQFPVYDPCNLLGPDDDILAVAIDVLIWWHSRAYLEFDTFDQYPRLNLASHPPPNTRASRSIPQP